jgi:hypothetical protein
MIEKIWSKKFENYDEDFNNMSDKLWEVWIRERDDKGIGNYHHIHAFQRRFGCKIVLSEDGSWIGLKFKNKGEYMLFILEWS